MSEPNPIVERIDALVRKRRSFVATPTGEAAHLTEESDAAADEIDDIPVLTEVFDISEVASDAPPLEPLLEALAAELTAAVASQLEADLPTIVDQAIAQIGIELRRGIGASIDTATREFLAQRQRLGLPLSDNPES